MDNNLRSDLKEDLNKIVKNETKSVDGKKIILNGLLRGGIILVFMGIGLYFQYKKGVDKTFMSILASTIIAVALSTFSAIYEYDVWSTKKKIIVHTICMMFTVIPALIISGWFDTSTIKGYLIILASFISFGIVAATLGYLISKYILKNVPEK